VISAVRALEKEWSVTARLVEDHKLATHGPYRLVRHPIYTGIMGLKNYRIIGSQFFLNI
jgi:protein-S-isoprenylcysteine O-methyltransferase Ste14